MNDKLLEVITTRGEMSLEEFDRSFDCLYSSLIRPDSDIRKLRRRTARWLDELGHCEFDFESRKVYCCNPALVLLPGAGCQRAVLTGARVSKLVVELKEFQKQHSDELVMSINPQSRDGIPLPNLITLEAIDKELLNQAANSVKITFNGKEPIAWVIANASSSLQEYEQLLQSGAHSGLSWPCRTFDTESLCFKRGDNISASPRLNEYTNPISQQKLHRWILSNFTATIEREWGRYLTLKHADKSIFLYDKRKQLLAVPAFVPLPKLLARSATLCSGSVAKNFVCKERISGIPHGTHLDVFVSLPETIAVIIADKLCQRLMSHNFTFTEDGEIS